MSFSIVSKVEPESRAEYLVEELAIASMWQQHPSIPAKIISTICIRSGMSRIEAARLLLANAVSITVSDHLKN
jgi:hypothetical protein